MEGREVEEERGGRRKESDWKEYITFMYVFTARYIKSVCIKYLRMKRSSHLLICWVVVLIVSSADLRPSNSVLFRASVSAWLKTTSLLSSSSCDSFS